ncbi:MAG TPA: hypothetical protein VGN16_11060 [Acidobacteriaceae bacterium]|jgi:hypothetical protein
MSNPRVWRFAALLLMFVAGVQAGWAMVDGKEVEVRRTTVPGIAESSVGTFDLTQPDALVWRSEGHTITMPYKTMMSFAYSNQIARHLGVLPAIAVGVVRKRERKHLFMFSWKDDSGVPQVLEVEVAKTAPRGLLEVLRVRAPQVCTRARDASHCGTEGTLSDD